MSLDECLRTHTHRQFLAWMEYLDEQWNEPKLSDFYLMQIACEVRRVLAKDRNAIQLKHFLLKFNAPELSLSSVAAAKAVWQARLAPVKRLMDVNRDRN